jgi:hypothetical protein
MLEVKGTLAKLLAQEDLIVEQKQVETASFDVERRILTLPLWEKAEASVIDMLIAHEVGHALYTPNKWDFLGEIPLSFVNVVEDVRIERLMKRRYAGIPKTFYNGYRDINSKDFFQLQFANLEDFGLIDRINLFHKVGMFHDIPFNNAQEIAFRDECAIVETFEEVLELAARIHKYQKEQVSESTSQTEAQEGTPTELPQQGSGDQIQSSQQEPESTEESNQQGQETPTKAEQEDGQNSEESQDEVPSPAQPNGKGAEGGKSYGDDLEAVTDSLLKESIQNLVDTESAPTEYITIPELLLDKVVVDTKEWVNCVEEHWSEKKEHQNFLQIDEEWKKYKTQSTKEVNYLVKEFEMKKSASAYARTTVSKTGVLDTAKLFQYKYNDDIFKKISVTPDGKNHGLIFNLDWSGSMSHILFSTMKQLLNLVQFCNKVGIPFEVYAFTNEWEPKSQKVEKIVENEIIIDNFSMIKFCSSELKKKELEKVMKYMFRLAFAMTYRYAEYGIPYKLFLSGTPLNEAIISMRQILPIFQKNNKVEKCHIINLTDGEGSCIMRNKKWGHYDYEKIMARHIGDCQLRDRKVGRIYKKFGHDYYGNSHTNIFVQNLRDNFPNTNLISIRLCSGTDFNRVSYNWEFDEREKNKAEWRKHKSFIDHNSAYTRSLYIQSNSLDDSENAFEVKEDARKQDIARAFKKSQKNKKTSKRILNEFISVIA